MVEPFQGESELGLASIEKLSEHINRVSSVMLDLEDDRLYNLLHTPENQDILSSFIKDSQRKVLSVTKSEDEVSLSSEVAYKGPTHAMVAFVKREGQSSLEDAPLGPQIQVMNLSYISPDSTPFELLHTYLQSCFAPLFNSYKGMTPEEEGKVDTKLGLSTVQKKISEMMLALMQCQQNVEIPEVHLVIDSQVKQRVNEAKNENRKISVELFEDLVNDKEFLGNLISCVDRWIHEIRKVTRLSNRDHLAPSILHEVNFWECLTKALTNIDQQLKQPEVTITLDILKQAKRVQAMMSFNADTGLDHALQNCSTYNILMKDFPANKLLSADTIEGIQEAIVAIFTHMKKLKHNLQEELLKK